MTKHVWILAVLLSVVSTKASAQMSASIAGGYFGYTGNDYEDVDGGLGLEGVIRFTGQKHVGLGVGGAFNRYGIDILNETVNASAVFAEIRYDQRNGALLPFVGGRLGWAREAADVAGYAFSNSGLLMGAVLGLDFPLPHGLDLEIALQNSYVTFGDAEIDGTTISSTNVSGFRYGLTVGLRLNGTEHR